MNLKWNRDRSIQGMNVVYKHLFIAIIVKTNSPLRCTYQIPNWALHCIHTAKGINWNCKIQEKAFGLHLYAQDTSCKLHIELDSRVYLADIVYCMRKCMWLCVQYMYTAAIDYKAWPKTATQPNIINHIEYEWNKQFGCVPLLLLGLLLLFPLPFTILK